MLLFWVCKYFEINYNKNEPLLCMLCGVCEFFLITQNVKVILPKIIWAILAGISFLGIGYY